MPVYSRYPSIVVPPVDLWSFQFDNPDRDFPDDHSMFTHCCTIPLGSLLTTLVSVAIYVDVTAKRNHTFSDVRTTAEQFGKGLIEEWGWRKGDILALITPNSTNVASVTFGTLYAGGVICPLNNLATVGELVQSLKVSGAKAVVTHTDCLNTVREAAKIAALPNDRILVIEKGDSQCKVQHFTSLQSSAQHTERPIIDPKDDLAFLVFSSGTTGLPKGVMLTHQNMVANVMQNDILGENFLTWRRDRALGFLPMYHIYGMSILSAIVSD